MRIAALAMLALLLAPMPASAQDNMPPRAAPAAAVTVGSLPMLDSTPAFDAEKATNAYLAKVNGAARARSDAYYEGGYWLQLADLVYALAIAGLLLGLRVSVGIREWLSDRVRGRVTQTIAFTAIYMAITITATLPLARAACAAASTVARSAPLVKPTGVTFSLRRKLSSSVSVPPYSGWLCSTTSPGCT